MQFSGKELTALIKMAFSMASADGKFADEEKEIITFGMAEFGLGQEEIVACVTAAQKMETAEAFSVLSSMDVEQQKYAVGYLAAVMASDGEIDDSEIKMWQLICTLADFPARSAGEALEFWQNN